MTQQELEELNGELAGWVGFTHLPYKLQSDSPHWARFKINDDCWIEPSYTEQINGHWSFYPPDFANSLDACFKWLVPETTEIISKSFKISMESALQTLFKWWLEEINNLHGKPALALCLAVEKLMDAGDK